MYRTNGRNMRHGHRRAIIRRRQRRHDSRRRRNKHSNQGARVAGRTSSTTGRRHHGRDASGHTSNRSRGRQSNANGTRRANLVNVTSSVQHRVPLVCNSSNYNHGNRRTNHRYREGLQHILQQAMLQRRVTFLGVPAQRMTTNPFRQRCRRHGSNHSSGPAHRCRRHRAHDTVPAFTANVQHRHGDRNSTSRLTGHRPLTIPQVNTITRLIERAFTRHNNRQCNHRHVHNLHNRPRRRNPQRGVTYKGGHRTSDHRCTTTSSP